MWQIPTGFTILSCIVVFILAILIKELPLSTLPDYEQSRQQQPSIIEMSQTTVPVSSSCTDISGVSRSTILTVAEKGAGATTNPSNQYDDSPISLREIFCNRIYRRCVLISVCMPLMQQGVGVNAILLYAGSIFKQLNFPDSDVVGAALLALWCVLAGVIAIPLVEQKGRRYLIFIGMPIILFSLILLMVSYLITNQKLTTVLLLVSIILYFLAFNFSIGPLIFTVCGESFPQRVRMRLMSFTFLIFRIISIVAMISFPYTLDILYVTFLLYFCIGLISTVLCWFSLPELKQKSPEEVEKAMLTEHVFELFTLTGKAVRRKSDVQSVEIK
ncbi:Sugar-proton symporter [Giardia lamblia P15]|uniref:Sugar-proton symporter n=1 Tax=Giardia intestinalis (strain P15) TaxID=658858 RepID=E1EZG6_GIAIA|nr:Sugar-proton symporter [Giardia lamblia P15]